MAKNNGTIKRVTRKRQEAPRTARKPRLAADAVAEIQGAAPQPPVTPPVVEMVELEVIEPAVEAAPSVVDAPAITVEPVPPPPRAVSVWPETPARMEPVRFRRVAFVRAILHRLRREAERRGAPIVRRVAARFPRLVALHESLRRWL
jgi:hypothetical protein